MPTKKKTASKTKTRAKKGSAKPARAKRSTTSRAMSSRIRKTAAGVLAGAAAGAVRALIPPLEEAAGASEKMARTKKKGQQRTSAGK
jgi:hypothetical protein